VRKAKKTKRQACTWKSRRNDPGERKELENGEEVLMMGVSVAAHRLAYVGAKGKNQRS